MMHRDGYSRMVYGVLVQMAQVLRITGDPDGAITAGQQALALTAALGDSALQGQASYTLGSLEQSGQPCVYKPCNAADIRTAVQQILQTV
jgi:hypothetical protein